MSGLFTFDVDLSDLRERCKRATITFRSGVAKAVVTAATEGLAEAKSRRRYKDRTGGLTGRAYVAKRIGSSNPEAVMVWPVSYASFVDAGTGPHTIRPKASAGLKGPVRESQTRRSRGTGPARRFLRFEIGGRVFYRTEVHHKGSRAFGFAGMAYHKAEAVLIREIESLAVDVERVFNG